MKKLIWVFVLLLTPVLSQAEWRSHFKHGHEREYNHYSFWNNISLRQDRQAARIERGVDNGQLTRREYKKLRREQKHIAKQIRHLKRHSHLSSAEKNNMREHLDFLSEKIRNLKHNDRYIYAKRSNNHKHGHQVHSSESRITNRLYTRASDDYTAGIYFRF